MPDRAGRNIGVTKLIPSDPQNSSDRIIMDLLRYWESLRAGRIAPLRSDFDPRQIKSALGLTFILDVDPIGGVRFRLAGQKVCDLMGMELRGMPARSILDPCHREEFDAALLDMTVRPKIVDYRLTAREAESFVPDARMLLLPMQSDDRQINRILGCFSLRVPVFDPPMRFTIREKYKTRIVTEPTATNNAGPVDGFAEDAEAFLPAGDTAPARPEAPLRAEHSGGTPPTRPQLRIVSDDYGKIRR